MAKVQLLQRLRLVPAPAPDSLPRPSPKPISSVQDADTRILSFPRGPAPGLTAFARIRARDRPLRLSLGLAAGECVQPLQLVQAALDQSAAHRRHCAGRADQPSRHAARLYRLEAALHHLPERRISIYGFGVLDLGREPVVVQVPDFGERYWVYPGDRSAGPTVSPKSARCTAPSPASTCWSAPIGRRAAAGEHHRGVPQLDQYRHRRSARVPGRTTRRTTSALQPLIRADPRLSAGRVRRHDEEQGLDRPPALSVESSSATRNGNGSTRTPSSTCCPRRSTPLARFPARRRSMR